MSVWKSPLFWMLRDWSCCSSGTPSTSSSPPTATFASRCEPHLETRAGWFDVKLGVRECEGNNREFNAARQVASGKPGDEGGAV
eukprot:2908671-Rhodomonas_salina.2